MEDRFEGINMRKWEIHLYYKRLSDINWASWIRLVYKWVEYDSLHHSVTLLDEKRDLADANIGVIRWWGSSVRGRPEMM